MRFQLAKAAAWLLKQFYVSKGPTYTLYYGRLNPNAVSKDIRRYKALKAYQEQTRKEFALKQKHDNERRALVAGYTLR